MAGKNHGLAPEPPMPEVAARNKIRRLTEQLMKANPALTIEAARTQILRESPELFVAAGLNSPPGGARKADRERVATPIWFNVVGAIYTVFLIGFYAMAWPFGVLACGGAGHECEDSAQIIIRVWGVSLGLIFCGAVAVGYVAQNRLLGWGLWVGLSLVSLVVFGFLLS